MSIYGTSNEDRYFEGKLNEYLDQEPSRTRINIEFANHEEFSKGVNLIREEYTRWMEIFDMANLITFEIDPDYVEWYLKGINQVLKGINYNIFLE